MNIFGVWPSIYAFLENCPTDPIRQEKELPGSSTISQGINKGFVGNTREHVPDLTSAQDIDLLAQLPL